MGLTEKLKAVAGRLRGPRHFARLRVEAELRAGEVELRLLPVLADPDRDFLDVGANDGAYAYYALPHFRSVIAVEAHPDMSRWLRRIIEPRGKVLAVALSDHEGSATLHIPLRESQDVTTRSSLEADANPGFEARTIEVPMTTVDALALDRVGVIKIDVEGHEFAVLNGAVETLKTARPLCIVECEERHNPGGVAKAFAFFGALGYRAYFLHRGKLRPGEEFDPALLQDGDNAKPIGGGRSLDYVNNFIFVHPDNDGGLTRIRRHLA